MCYGAFLTVVVNMLRNRLTSNLLLRNIIENTLQILDQATIRISHCYREANQVADYLAKLAGTLTEGAVYHSFQQLPGKAKGPLLMDNDKANFFVS